MALTSFCSQILADTGISMGDEGKGRLVYELIQELQETTGKSSPVQMVMKVNGGANSGHTAAGLKLNLLPAGVVAKSVPYLGIGAGVVADPRKFWWEAYPLEQKGYDVLQRLRIDERTQVSDVCHRLLDLAWEHYRVEQLAEAPRGSTGRGITPAYCDEVGQWQIFYADFLGEKEVFARKLRQRAERICRTIQHVCMVPEATWNGFFDLLSQAEVRANTEALQAGLLCQEEIDFTCFRCAQPFTLNIEKLVDVYWHAGQRLRNQVCDVRELVLAILDRGEYIIGEFGQSFWLDKRHGFAPNVTASHTYSPEFFQSAGIPVQPIHTVGVAKAYDTKVGTHLFLTQFPDNHPLGERLKKLEFGTSTGRQRMVGWFDAVEKGDALRFGGFQDIMINKLDALSHSGDWQGKLKVCVAYQDEQGQQRLGVPRDDRLRTRLKPVFEEYEGWSEDISGVRHFADLPVQAQDYVKGMVRSMLNVAYRGNDWPKDLPNLRYIGVGPDPSQIIKDIPETRALLS
jgi:adenylosuccinate synthase